MTHCFRKIHHLSLLLLLLTGTTTVHAQIVLPAAGDINSVAGYTAGYYGDGGLATVAQLNIPFKVAVDSSGNVYIADYYNNRIRMVTASTGIISTIAGNGTAGYSGDGGAATSAQINTPWAVAVDSSGNIYFADNVNERIREVTASTGIISTVAGDGTGGYSGDGGLATSAELYFPAGVTVDSIGNLYIADGSNCRVRKVTVSTGIISTVAGNGTYPYSGSGGLATSAGIFVPSGVALDSSNNLYIADSNDSRILAVNLRSVPTITWTTPAAITYGTALSATQLNATASVAGTFVYTPDSGTVLGAGSQTLSVTLTPTDTFDYSTATQTVTLHVNQATPTITWVVPLNATANVGGTFSYTPTIGTVLTSGAHSLTVTFTPTDTADYTTATSTATLTVP